MQIETLIDKLTGILEGVVGGDKKPRITGGIVTESTVKWARIDGYNQALADTRSRIPEAMDGILGAVREEVVKFVNEKGMSICSRHQDWNPECNICAASCLRPNELISSLAGGDADGEGI